MIKYTIACPNCDKTKTFERFPCRKERQYCNRSCAASYLNRKTWADPEVRARRLKGMARAMQSEEYSVKQKKAWASDERRKAAAERARKYLPITIHQPGAYEKMCKTKRDEEHRDLARQQAFERWRDPEFHSRAVETLRETHNTPEYHDAASKRAQERWDDPKTAKEWAGSFSRRPTKPELALLEFLHTNGYERYKYTGDGSFIIGRKNPDFIFSEQGKIIELFGACWHTEDEIEPRTEYFAEYGFDTLIIWDYELEDTEQLLIKLKEFHQSTG